MMHPTPPTPVSTPAPTPLPTPPPTPPRPGKGGEDRACGADPNLAEPLLGDGRGVPDGLGGGGAIGDVAGTRGVGPGGAGGEAEAEAGAEAGAGAAAKRAANGFNGLHGTPTQDPIDGLEAPRGFMAGFMSEVQTFSKVNGSINGSFNGSFNGPVGGSTSGASNGLPPVEAPDLSGGPNGGPDGVGNPLLELPPPITVYTKLRFFNFWTVPMMVATAATAASSAQYLWFWESKVRLAGDPPCAKHHTTRSQAASPSLRPSPKPPPSPSA